MSTRETPQPPDPDEAPVKKSDRFPPGIPFIVGNEGAERFSFYGMRAILYVYLTSLFLKFVPEAHVDPTALGAAKAHATEVVHLFQAGVYAFPMIGAILADRLLGKYKVIFWVSLIYVVGHGVLAFGGRLGHLEQFGAAEFTVYAGLALIALGSGGIKPCVSANVGDQFTAENGHLVNKVFQAFYFIINYGSFFATLIIPLMQKWFGAEAAFALPGVLMAIAAVVFWAGRGRFVKVPPKPGGKLALLDFAAAVLFFAPFVAFAFFGMGPAIAEYLTNGKQPLGEFVVVFLADYKIHLAISIIAPLVGFALFSARQKLEADKGFLAVLLYSARHQHLRKPGMRYFEVAKEKFGEEAAEGPPAVLRVMLVFSMVSVFWALFDQHSSTWVEQAKQMDLALTVPKWLGLYGVAATICLSVYGGVWLLLWVSNVAVPRWVNLSVLGIVGAIGVVAAGLQLSGGERIEMKLLPSQLPSFNPLMVMMIIPFLNLVVWRPLEKRNITVTPLQRMTAGMFLAVFAFLFAGLLQLKVQAAPGQVHALWQFLQYFVMTSAEVLVSATGLEFAYTQAPRAMKSTIMGFWLLCITIGNLIVAFLAPLEKSLPLSSFFFVFAGLMGVAAVVFAIMAWFYKGRSYLQNGAAAE